VKKADYPNLIKLEIFTALRIFYKVEEKLVVSIKPMWNRNVSVLVARSLKRVCGI
jgi:hypothetical protein